MGNERYNLVADNAISNDGHMKAAQLATKLAEANGKRFAAEDKLEALLSEIETLIDSADFYVTPGYQLLDLVDKYR
jgi:hypothetical protein